MPPKVPPHLAMNVAVGGRPGPASGTPISALRANFRSAAKNVEPLSLSPQSLPTGAPAGYGERNIAPPESLSNTSALKNRIKGEQRQDWVDNLGKQKEPPPPPPPDGVITRAGKAVGDARAAIGERFRKARIGLENGPVADAVAGAQGKVEGVGRKVRDVVRDRRAAQAAKNAPAPPSAAIPETFSDPKMAPAPAPPPPSGTPPLPTLGGQQAKASPPSLSLSAPPPSISPEATRGGQPVPSAITPSAIRRHVGGMSPDSFQRIVDSAGRRVLEAHPSMSPESLQGHIGNVGELQRVMAGTGTPLPPPKVLAHINAQGSSAGPATVNQAPRSGAFKAVASPAPAATGGTQLSAQATPPPAPVAAPVAPPAAGPVSQGPKTVQRAVNQAEMTWNQPPAPNAPQQVTPVAAPGLRRADGSYLDKGERQQQYAQQADQAARAGGAPVPQGGNLAEGPAPEAAAPAVEEASAAPKKEIKNKKPPVQQEQEPAGPGWTHYIPHALGAAGLGLGGKMLYDSFHDGDEKRSSVDIFLSNYKPSTQPQQKVAAPSARSFLEMIR